LGECQIKSRGLKKVPLDGMVSTMNLKDQGARPWRIFGKRKRLLWIEGESLISVTIIAALSVCSFAQTPALHNYHVGGESYFALDEVAGYCGFSYEANGNTAKLRSGGWTLRFSADPRRDTRESMINGYNVWLTGKMIDWQGRLLLPGLDFGKTIYPILWPRPNPATKPTRIIVLDPGHGGSDEGAKDYGLIEKDLTLDVARRLKSKIEESERGVTVLLTRQSDTKVSLESRVQFAKTYRADLFVSIHFNAIGAGQARGIETYCLTPAGAASSSGSRRNTSSQDGNVYDMENIFLAYCIHAYAISGTGMPDHGLRRARFAVLTEVPCPAALIECGFVTNRTDAAQIASTSYRDQLASSVSRGILAYKRTFDTSTPTATAEE
jgi:N-acetylmuramoyl-L-alanine amidase